MIVNDPVLMASISAAMSHPLAPEGMFLMFIFVFLISTALPFSIFPPRSFLLDLPSSLFALND